MSKLIESIVSGDFVSANNLFEQRIEQIAEKKLYETKRMMQTEVVKPVKGKPGEFTGQNTPADWAKYRKAHPALGMYDTPSSKGKKPESKVAKQRKAGYVKAEPALKALEFIKRVRKYKETGKVDEATVVQQAQQHAAAIERMGKEPRKPQTSALGMTGKKGKENPVPPGTQRGFKAPLTRAPVGTQKGFTAPLKGPEKTPTKDDGVTSGMRKIIRQKYREKTGVTAGGLAKKSLGKAFGKGTSLSGRLTALKRAGKALSFSPAGAIAGAVAGRAASGVGAGLNNLASQYGG